MAYLVYGCRQFVVLLLVHVLVRSRLILLARHATANMVCMHAVAALAPQDSSAVVDRMCMVHYVFSWNVCLMQPFVASV